MNFTNYASGVLCQALGLRRERLVFFQMVVLSGLASIAGAQTAPRVTNQPIAQSVMVGASVSFFVAATGSTPLSYQWRKNGVNIAGANSALYSISSVTLTHAGTYSVLVGNSVSNTLSVSVSLAVSAPVIAPPVITLQPQSQSVSPGNFVTLQTAASGTAPLTYQWRKDGSAIAGATKTSLTFTSVVLADAGNYTVVVSNAAANVISSTASLSVAKLPPTAPSISTQPIAQAVTTGSTAVFSVVASGTLPLFYQWTRDGTAVAGATNNRLEIASAAFENAGLYTVVVSNEAANVVSSSVLLTVNAPVGPAITTQPQAQTVTRGGTVNLSVAATGTAPLAYQWKKDGVLLQGATKATYSKVSVQDADAGDYSVSVSNAVGEESSNTVKLVVTAPVPPSITTQPISRSVVEGNSASFTVSVAGTAPFSYQWKFEGVNISGATNANFTRGSAVKSHAGKYMVTVTNAAGSADSMEATLTVSSPVTASISTQPISRGVLVGDSVTFAVVADGTPPFSYQWKKNGINVSGANQASYSIKSVGLADAGSYSVSVANQVGTALSKSAALSVEVPKAPSITIQPSPQTVKAGSAFGLRVSASGTEPLSYQWRRNGVNIAGATDASYSILSASSGDAGGYVVIVSNRVANVVSGSATITVEQFTAVAPSISTEPRAQSVQIGSAVIFSVTASGTPPLAFQWRKNGNLIPGANQATFKITTAASADAGSYSVSVSNSAAVVLSASAALEVRGPVSLPPSLTTQPVSQSVPAGSSVVFAVVATGTAPFGYQWRKDGSPIAGATNASLKIQVAASADVGDYSVLVSNSVANTVSATARLTVDSSKVPGPSIQSHPSGVTVVTGDRARLRVIATGSSVLTYQWFEGRTGVVSAPVAGGTQAALTTPALGSSTSFWVRVTDAVGRFTDSSAASISVGPASMVTASHQAVGSGYVAGGGVIITGIISYSGAAPSRIVWSTLLPPGWKYLGSGGNEGVLRPSYESSELLEWTWTTVPPSPIKFTFMASVPAGTSGDQSVGSIISSQIAGSPYQTMAKPDPLVIRRLESAP
jgi:hypothetical protein